MNRKLVAIAGTDVAPQGTVSVSAILRYLQRVRDCYMTKQQAAEYLNIKPREVDRVLPANLRMYVGQRVRFRKSELDRYMESTRSGRSPQSLDRLVEEVLREVKK